MVGLADTTLDEIDIINSIDDALMVVDGGLNLIRANLRAFELFASVGDGPTGAALTALPASITGAPGLMMLLKAVAEHDVTIDGYDLTESFPIIGKRTLRVRARRLRRSGLRTTQSLILVRDVTPRVRAFEKSAAAAERSHARIAETNHRVKNNLTSILSMLRLERQSVTEVAAQDAIDRISIRVEAIARLYELLAIDSDTGSIDLIAYVTSVCRSIERLSHGPNDTWSIAVEGDTLALSVSDAIAIGAIVHELVANAVKYAFCGMTGRGTIKVSTNRRPAELTLTIFDDGIGIRADRPTEPSTRLGMRLVDGHVANLRGTIERENPQGGGTRYTIRIPHGDSGPVIQERNRAPRIGADSSVVLFRQQPDR